MSLYSMIAGKGASGFGYGSTAEQVTEGLDLTGQTHLITGCNSGIGLETLRVLKLRGATVIGLARTAQKALDAGADHGVACELADPGSVRAAVQSVRDLAPLDSLIANAGIMALPSLQTAHGYELQFFTNHIGHFILVTGLLDRLAPTGRVALLSSSAHQTAPRDGIHFDNLDGSKSYAPWTAYGTSKLSNLLMARELAKRLPAGQTANAVHPGVIATNLSRHMPIWQSVWLSVAVPIALKSVGEGAATQSWAAVNPGAASFNGEYMADCNVATSSKPGQDAEMARKLWEVSEQIVAKLP